MRARRHVLSIDDGPFDKYRDREALLVGVVTAGGDLVEGVLTTRVPVDGDRITERMAEWTARSRFRPVLRAVLINGLTTAGLSVVDLTELSRLLDLPAISVQRRPPRSAEVLRALEAAGLPERGALLERAGPSHLAGEVSFFCAGVDPAAARAIIEAESGRSNLPEGLRLAHIIAQGLVLGESRGRA